MLPRALSVLFALMSALFLFSCDNESDEATHAWLGGQIINPTTNYLILSQGGQLVDTIYFDEKNRFSYRLDSVKRGLYVIKHQPETQNIYIAPGDSILLRANTLAFDESLQFSGKGKARNNFLAEMFLLDEKNSDLLVSFYKIKPREFAKKTDSIKQERLNFLSSVAKKKNLSPDFVEMANRIINYESYDLKERYTYLVQKYHKQFIKDIPSNFHSYREEVNFNEKTLHSSPTYRRFIDNYLINYSIKWCAQSNNDNDDCYDLSNHKNLVARINKASEIIQAPVLREHFLSKLGVLGILMAKDKQDIISTIELLSKKGLSDEKIEEMKQLGAIQLAYLPGTTLEGIPLLTTEGKKVVSSEVISKPTIIFLWSIYSSDYHENHQLIERLQEKYPEVDFVGINLDIDEFPKWKMAVDKYGYSPENEFQLGQTAIKKEFFQYYINKILFLDADGKVVMSDTFINSPEFESRILEFLNQ